MSPKKSSPRSLNGDKEANKTQDDAESRRKKREANPLLSSEDEPAEDEYEDEYDSLSLQTSKKRRCSYCGCCFGVILCLMVVAAVSLAVLGDFDWDTSKGIAESWLSSLNSSGNSTAANPHEQQDHQKDQHHDTQPHDTQPHDTQPHDTQPHDTQVATQPPEEKRTPRFILHIGPHKTGTTTIQCGLLRRPHALGDYDVKYMGKTPLGSPPCGVEVDDSHEDGKVLHAMMHDMPRLHQCVNRDECWKRFRGMVRHSFQLGKELVWSDEYLAFKTTQMKHQHPGFSKERQYFWKQLLDALHQPHAVYNVTVVVAYRRYHDWLASSKLQVEKSNPSCMPRLWPKDRNVTFQEDYCITAPMWPRLQAYMNDRHRTPYPYTDELLKTLAEEYPKLNVHLINLHNNPDQDLVATFVCDVIQGSSELCQASETDWDVIWAHSAEHHAYDAITVAAWQRGYITSTISRSAALKSAEKFHKNVLNETETDLPQSCPTKEELQPLLEQSRQLEEKIVPDFYHNSPLGKDAFEDAFWASMEKNKFCSVDLDQVLADTRWQEFFQSL